MELITGLLIFILAVLSTLGYLTLPYILWYKAKSSTDKLIWLLTITFLPYLVPLFYLRAEKGVITVRKNIGLVLTYFFSLIVIMLFMILIISIAGAPGYQQVSVDPIVFEQNMTTCDSDKKLKYWNYMVNLPVENILYQNKDTGKEISSYRMVYRLNKAPKGITFNNIKNKKSTDQIILNKDAFGLVYAKQDSLCIPLARAKFTTIDYECPGEVYYNIYEEIYWNEALKILNYYVVYEGS